MYTHEVMLLKIIYTKSYDSTYKDLKKHQHEKDILEKVLKYIARVESFSYMICDPLAQVYHFERLKYELNEFYSFRLSKVYRLIVRPRDNDIEVELVYISSNHYVDFDKDRVRL